MTDCRTGTRAGLPIFATGRELSRWTSRSTAPSPGGRQNAPAPEPFTWGTLAEIASAERAPWEGRVAERPFVLLAQHTLFDASQAPEGKHTAWAYCHVPNGSSFDTAGRIEAQIERFAPGFRDVARSQRAAASAELGGATAISSVAT